MYAIYFSPIIYVRVLPKVLLQLKMIHCFTGGYCFLPDSRPVAYRLFEMEALLTLKDRHSSQPVSPVTSQVHVFVIVFVGMA